MPTKALVAGINDYGGRNSLPSCVQDATAFAAMLQKNLGVPPGNIKSLHDHDATKDGLKAGLQWLFSGATPDDRLVFYYSGHGYQPVINGELREALVTQDGQFFDDTELAEAMAQAPAGVLTIVLDTCFSGGLEKVFVNGEIHLGQPKAWTPPEGSAAASKAFSTSVTSVRPFGLIAPAVFKGYIPGAGANVDELTLPASKGLLVSAAQANETASASLPSTNGMSAFTFALLEQIQWQGVGRSTLMLANAAADKLTDIGVRQTPTVRQPIAPPRMGELSFISLKPLKSATSTLSSTSQENTMNAMINGSPTSLSNLVYPADKAWYDTVLRIATAVVPAAIQAVQSKGFVPSTQPGLLMGQQVDEKVWYDTVLRVATAVVPAAIQAVQSKGFTPGVQPLQGVGQSADEKAWYDTVFRIATAVVPAAIQAVQSKGFSPVTASLQPSLQIGQSAEEKAWYDTVLRVATAVVPAAIQAVQSKGFTPGVPTLTPGGVDAKAWYDTVLRVATAAIPAAIQAVQSKGYTPGGLPSFPVAQTHEEKAWYDTLASLAPLGLALL